MKNTLETRLGMFVALALIAAVLILETLGGIERFQRGYPLHALFKNIQDLKVGDRVKMAGVEVGRVSGIQLTNNQVMVSMKLRKNTPVKTDSLARIQFTGLMGQNFVAIDFGTTGFPQADVDTFLRTEEQPDISMMIEKIDDIAVGIRNVTDSFTGEKIDNLLGPLIDTVSAAKFDLTSTLTNVNRITGQIASGEGTVGKMIYDDGALYKTAQATLANLETASVEMKLGLAEARTVIADARGIMAQVNAGQGTAGKLLKDEALYNETTASMTNLRGILEKINQGQGSVGKLVNDQEFYRNAKLSLQKLDKATEGLEDQGPLSVIGLVVGNLF